MSNERIKADAEAYAERENSAYVNDYNGYIAGATAENSRAQVLVDALEAIIKNGENVRSAYRVDKPAFYIKIARKALEQWKGKEVEPKPQQPDLGTCVECGIRKAVADYNGHQYHVCDPCNNRLNREFDKEYN